MRDQRSFSSIDSLFLSVGDMSSLMERVELRRDPLFERTLVASAALINFTRSGLGFLLSREPAEVVDILY